jgi:hypothetical protein
MAGGTSGSALQGLTRRFISRGSKYINGSKIVITDVSASNELFMRLKVMLRYWTAILHQHKLLGGSVKSQN